MPKSPALIRHPERGREAAQRKPDRPAREAPAWASWTDQMAGPRRQAAQIAALVGQRAPVAAMRLDELKPRPVDDGRDESRDQAPPQVAIVDLDRHSCRMDEQPEAARRRDDDT